MNTIKFEIKRGISPVYLVLLVLNVLLWNNSIDALTSGGLGFISVLMESIPVYFCILLCCISIYQDVSPQKTSLIFSTPQGAFKILISKFAAVFLLYLGFHVIRVFTQIFSYISNPVAMSQRSALQFLQSLVIQNSTSYLLDCSYILIVAACFLITTLMIKKMLGSHANLPLTLVLYFAVLLFANYLNFLLFVKADTYLHPEYFVLFSLSFYQWMLDQSSQYLVLAGNVVMGSGMIILSGFLYEKVKDNNKWIRVGGAVAVVMSIVSIIHFISMAS